MKKVNYISEFIHRSKRHIWKISLSVLSGVIRSTLMLLPTMMLQKLMNSATEAGTENLAVYGALYIICPLTVLILYVLDTWLSRFVYDIIKEIRLHTLKKIVIQPISWVTKTSHQELYNKVIQSSLAIADFYFSTLSNLVWYTTTIVVGFLLMAQINLSIAMMLIAVSLCQIFGVGFLKEQVKKTNKQKQKAVIEGDTIAKNVIDYGAYLRVLELGSTVQAAERKWRNNFSEAEQKLFFMNLLADFQTILCELARVVILLIFSQKAVAAGEMPVGDIYGMNAYILWLTPVFFGLQRWFISLFSSLNNQKRMDDILTLPESNEERGQEFCEPVISLKFKNLGFHYPNSERVLFHDICGNFSPGETLVIRGELGSGKTTLIKLLLEFESPTEGEILLNGKNLNTYEESSLHQQIVVASQHTEFVHGTVRENLLLSGTKCPDEKIFSVLQSFGLWELVMNLPHGLDTEISGNSVSFSDGERKRFGIARALLSNATVVIFDEPTASLDQKTKKPIIDVIRSTCQDKICVIVTHDEEITGEARVEL